MATGRPTPQDRVAAIRIALGGLAAGDELGDIARAVEPFHPRNNTFLGEVLLELAADAIEESGATRDEPLETEGIRKRLLPEDRAETKAQHHKAEGARQEVLRRVWTEVFVGFDGRPGARPRAAEQAPCRPRPRERPRPSGTLTSERRRVS